VGDAGECVLGPGGLLNGDCTNSLSVADPRETIGHVLGNTFLSGDDRSDACFRNGFQDRGEGEQEHLFNAFSLEDLGDRLVNSHGRGLPGCGRSRRVWQKPICGVWVICVPAGILAATGGDLNTAALLATGWTDFDFLADKSYNVSSPWPWDQLLRSGA
jgi:hypothetical protein